MNKSKKFDDWMLLFCIVMNGLCVVANIARGGNPIALAMSAFAAGAVLSGLVFNQLHKKAMKLCDQSHESARKAYDLARSALHQSITIMANQVDRYKRGD